jgi:hypothetical protein
MPLITLLNETKLKSLGFGNDRPDGASSNQPYIQTPIPEERETNSPDFLLRNGNSNLQNSENDVSRLIKYFTDDKSPEGLLFVAKQQLLERQNVDVVDDINRIYNPIGTITQAGIVSLGGHLNKQGFIFTRQGYYNSGRDGYYYSTIAANEVDEDRLSLLFKAKKVPDDPNNLTTAVGEKIYNITPSSDVINLISYPGGPGSTLGIGKTNIRIQNSTLAFTNYNPEEGYYNGGMDGYYFATKGLGEFPRGQYLSTGELENRLTIAYTAKLALNPENKLPESLGELSINPYGITSEAGNTVLLTYPERVKTALGLNLGNSTVKILNSTRPIVDVKDDKKYQPNFYRVKPSDPLYLTPGADLIPLIPGWSYELIRNSGASTAWLEQFDDGADNIRRNFLPKIFSLGFNNNINDKLKYLNRNTTDTLTTQKININSEFYNDEHVFNFKQITDQESKSKTQNTSLSNISDFRSKLNFITPLSGQVLPSTDYSKFNREDTYKDSKTTYRGNWKIDSEGAKRIFDPNQWISEDQKEVGVLGEDIIDFNFSVLSNTVGSGTLQLIDFRAYIENWNDDLKAEWNSVKYMGRAENFYKYSGFSRDISITFLVPALSRGDMLSNYKKLNALAGTVAPSYSPNSADIPGVMRGSITKFTMGNYFRGMPSIIKGVQFSEIENMGWDINRDIDGNIIPLITEDPSSDGFTKLFIGQLPKGIKVTVNLTPLHNFVPQYGEPFIGDYSNTNPKLENIYTY